VSSQGAFQDPDALKAQPPTSPPTADESGQRAMPRRLHVLSLGVTLLLMGGCGSLTPTKSSGEANRLPRPVDRDTTVALILADTIQTLERLAKSSRRNKPRLCQPAAPVTNGAAGQRSIAIRAGAGDTRPRCPGPRACPPVTSRAGSTTGAPCPVERALGLLELAQLERELGLKAENDRLQAADERDSRERQAASSRACKPK